MPPVLLYWGVNHLGGKCYICFHNDRELKGVSAAGIPPVMAPQAHI